MTTQMSCTFLCMSIMVEGTILEVTMGIGITVEMVLVLDGRHAILPQKRYILTL